MNLKMNLKRNIKMKNRNLIRLTTLAIAIAGTATMTSAEQPRHYKTHVMPDSLMLEPLSEQAMTSKIDLIIKGPQDFHLRESFEGGTLVEINPIELAGGHLPDGTYKFETRNMGTAAGPAQRGQARERDSQIQLSSTSGTFSIKNGQLVTPETEARNGKLPDKATASAHGTQAESEDGTRDQIIADDQIIQGSLCVGLDCVNGENFGFDTIRMKENNTRIKFEDTSTSGSFPNNDWQLTANDSANGGLNKFSIENTTVGRIPFTVEGSAPTNSLWIDDGGRIGFGTSTPVVENHIVDGDSPTIRLEQDGSSGFQAQTWDMAGNETNFFVRDVTNGSLLPFKIRPGAATDSLVIDAQGDVAIGVANADTKLHVKESENGNITNVLLLENTDTNGGALMAFSQGNGSSQWRVGVKNTDKFEITKSGSGEVELEIIPEGSAGAGVYVNSALFVDAQQLNVPDYVFEKDYKLLSLDELQSFIVENKHLPGVQSSAEIQTAGHIDLNEFQMRLLEKIEELTLHTLAQEKRIKELETAILAAH